jgi:hypothetical protein
VAASEILAPNFIPGFSLGKLDNFESVVERTFSCSEQHGLKLNSHIIK